MSSKVIKLLFAFILLFAGGIIYVAFRTESLAMFSWFRALHLGEVVERVRDASTDTNLPYFVKYCLPNGLWIASYIFATDALVEDKKLLWALALPGIAIICEFLQLLGIIPGTFDFGDLLCLIVPSLLYIIYYVVRYEKHA